MKTSIWTIGVAASAMAGMIAMSPAVPAAAPNDTMPLAQQNLLVQKYCAVCHTDAHPNGGLSLQHFDAAHLDPGLADMVASKLNSGAMTAAGIPPPDAATQAALLRVMLEKSAGASSWTVSRTKSPTTQAPVLVASIVQELPSPTRPEQPDLYRLKLTCRLDTREAEMQLAWSPATPKADHTISAAADGQAPQRYALEGNEKMGNGAAGTSGPGAIVLSSTPLPTRTLTISDVFKDQTVAFPIDRLDKKTRRALSACFPQTTASR